MIRAAEPCYNLLTRHLPRQWSRLPEHIGTGAPATPSSGHLWKRLLRAMVVNTLIYGILSIAVIALMFSLRPALLPRTLHRTDGVPLGRQRRLRRRHRTDDRPPSCAPS